MSEVARIYLVTWQMNSFISREGLDQHPGVEPSVKKNWSLQSKFLLYISLSHSLPEIQSFYLTGVSSPSDKHIWNLFTTNVE